MARKRKRSSTAGSTKLECIHKVHKCINFFGEQKIDLLIRYGNACVSGTKLCCKVSKIKPFMQKPLCSNTVEAKVSLE